MNLTGWALFWTIWLMIAGTSFACISVIVTILGLRDLKNLFFRLLQEQHEGE